MFNYNLKTFKDISTKFPGCLSMLLLKLANGKNTLLPMNLDRKLNQSDTQQSNKQ